MVARGIELYTIMLYNLVVYFSSTKCDYIVLVAARCFSRVSLASWVCSQLVGLQ